MRILKKVAEIDPLFANALDRHSERQSGRCIGTIANVLVVATSAFGGKADIRFAPITVFIGSL
jgi:hypothetical protein